MGNPFDVPSLPITLAERLLMVIIVLFLHKSRVFAMNYILHRLNVPTTTAPRPPKTRQPTLSRPHPPPRLQQVPGLRPWPQRPLTSKGPTAALGPITKEMNVTPVYRLTIPVPHMVPEGSAF